MNLSSDRARGPEEGRRKKGQEVQRKGADMEKQDRDDGMIWELKRRQKDTWMWARSCMPSLKRFDHSEANPIAMASNIRAMAFNLPEMASNLSEMASNLPEMASHLL